MPRILVLAYGNPMRSDDGVAWRAAAVLENKFPGTDVEITCTRQLTPELAENVSRCEAVIFVDAATAVGASPGDIHSAEIHSPQPQELPQARFSHQLSPEAVVALAGQLFAARPQAFSVTVTGACFDHGESLSPAAAAALPSLVARVEQLIQDFLRVAGPAD